MRLSAWAPTLGSFGGKLCPRACTSKSPFVLWDLISKSEWPWACCRTQGWKGPANAEIPNRDDMNSVPSNPHHLRLEPSAPRTSQHQRRLRVPALRSQLPSGRWLLPVLLSPPQLLLYFLCFINSWSQYSTGQPGFLILPRCLSA